MIAKLNNLLVRFDFGINQNQNIFVWFSLVVVYEMKNTKKN